MPESRAAALRVELPTWPGLWLTGYGARAQPSNVVADPIAARAVMLDDGQTRVVLVSCDLLGLSPTVDAQLRQRIARSSGTSADRVLISCTHTHAAPACMPLRGVMGHVDQAWLAAALERIVEMSAGLAGGLAPARWRTASVQLPGIGYNRQDRAHGLDEELGVAAIDTADGRAIATLVNYGVHAVILTYENRSISAEFPGEAARRLEQARGGVAMYFMGGCGDVDPICRPTPGGMDEVRRVGDLLAGAAVDALSAAAPAIEPAVLAMASQTVDIPVDPLPAPAEIDAYAADQERQLHQAQSESNAIALAQAQAMLEWAQAAKRALADGTAPRSAAATLSVLRVGDWRLAACPFEVFSDIALAVKAALGPGRTFLAGYTNGLYGYCFGEWARRQGGYASSGAYRWFAELLTPLSSGADALLQRELTALGRRL